MPCAFRSADALGAGMMQMRSKPKPKKKRMTQAEYNRRMDEIIASGDHVADALIKMIEFAATVEIVSDKPGKH